MTTKDEIKIAMMTAVSRALGHEDPNPQDVVKSELYQKAISEIDHVTNKEMKIAMIAAISRAIKYRDENPQASNKEITQKVMNECDEILEIIEKNK